MTAQRYRASCVVYSCTYADYDFTLGPLASTTDARYLRFTDTRRWRGLWTHQPIPPSAAAFPTQTLTNRYMKLFPRKFFPEAEVAVYVDGNILIKSDLSPLISEFRESGAAIALFPHPSGRDVAQEFDFCLEVGRIKPADAAVAEQQRQRYQRAGVLDMPVTENSIIFYDLRSDLVDALGEAWWQELETYTSRDQVSLPYVLKSFTASTLRWDWHFTDPENPYFARYGHRYKKTRYGHRYKKNSFLREELRKIRFMEAHHSGYGVAAQLLRAGGRLGRALGVLRRNPGAGKNSGRARAATFKD